MILSLMREFLLTEMRCRPRIFWVRMSHCDFSRHNPLHTSRFPSGESCFVKSVSEDDRNNFCRQSAVCRKNSVWPLPRRRTGCIRTHKSACCYPPEMILGTKYLRNSHCPNRHKHNVRIVLVKNQPEYFSTESVKLSSGIRQNFEKSNTSDIPHSLMSLRISCVLSCTRFSSACFSSGDAWKF